MMGRTGRDRGHLARNAAGTAAVRQGRPRKGRLGGPGLRGLPGSPSQAQGRLRGQLIRIQCKRAEAVKKLLTIICLVIAACAPTPHPITASPPISDAETAQHLCLDYAKQTVPASSLAAAIATAVPRQAAFDRCMAAHGWAG